MIFRSLIIFSLTVIVTHSRAQSVSGSSIKQVSTLILEVSNDSQSGIFHFPELESRKYFVNTAKKEKIEQLVLSSQEDKAWHLLRSYIRKFSVSNFRMDAPLLLEMVRLSEKFGTPQETLFWIKLILKHRPAELDSLPLIRRYTTLELFNEKIFLDPNQYADLISDGFNAEKYRLNIHLPENLGSEINSRYPDYAPVMGNQDNLLLFSSKRNRHNIDLNAPADEDLFISRKTEEQWQKPVELVNINTTNNEGSACLSRDGKTLYFSRCNAPGSIGNCDLYVARLNRDSVWSDIQNLGANVNSVGWESHPALTPRGDTLYFASNRLGGFGLSDIYFSVKGRNGKWSKARNAGPVINTQHSEVSPFVHHKYNELYYSSDGLPASFGDFDIYRANRKKHYWTEPVNLGPLVNTAGSEYYFTMDAQSIEMYYAGETESAQNLDLYSRLLPMEAQPNANTILSGKALKADGSPESGVVVVTDQDDAIEIAPKILNESGAFSFRLIRGHTYTVTVKTDNQAIIQKQIHLVVPHQRKP